MPIEEKFKIADELLNLYSNAKLVVTSRIHAALPCLSFETPTIFITSEKLEKGSSAREGGRFEGIIELFNYFIYKDGSLVPGAGSNKSKIRINSIPKNPELYRQYQMLLDRKVKDFVNSCK